MEDFIPNPCTRNCTLNDDDICLGCFRSQREILDWHGMTHENKRQTLEKCEQRRHKHPSLLQRIKKMINKPF